MEIADWQTVGQYAWKTEISGSYKQKAALPVVLPLWRIYIKGPAGNVYCSDIADIYPNLDYINFLYWEMIAVLDGHYHCCFSGKTFIF